MQCPLLPLCTCWQGRGVNNRKLVLAHRCSPRTPLCPLVSRCPQSPSIHFLDHRPSNSSLRRPWNTYYGYVSAREKKQTSSGKGRAGKGRAGQDNGPKEPFPVHCRMRRAGKGRVFPGSIEISKATNCKEARPSP